MCCFTKIETSNCYFFCRYCGKAPNNSQETWTIAPRLCNRRRKGYKKKKNLYSIATQEQSIADETYHKDHKK